MSRATACRDASPGSNRPDAGLTIRELRQLRRMSLRDAERETGYNRGVLSEIERGNRVPTPAHLLALSDLYGVPPDEWRLHIEYRIPEEVAA